MRNIDNNSKVKSELLDEFDLAGLKLTEEKKIQFRKFDIDMDKIVTLLNSFNKDKLSELENSARKLAENKPSKTSSNRPYNNKSWKKNKFYE
ncbi:TPA: hypothetical protein PTV74_003148 [Clostridium botulinum]|nr:hypothetical protein [Clostridium botulinum]HDK7206303.1 hypothetical protein [Clostridium botulinum]HDK7210039.1 hypothetical protein [Clostridium botulinum]HDK7265488.1 hypothetical protein [Clostridium botulinum]HDK7269336.1 hypothetical protein [Clostridium botulinum]